MAIKNIGAPLSFSEIATELGIANYNVSINQSNLRNLAIKPTGKIKMSDFYGKSNKTKSATPIISHSQLRNTYVKFSSNVTVSEF